MSIEAKSQTLKEIVATYDTPWFLGDLSDLMHHIAEGRGQDRLGRLSSPLRQLYFLAGLLITSNPSGGTDHIYRKDKWDEIVDLLNEIEFEYDKTFFPKTEEEITAEWKHIRKVAIPSFLSYFNQGPLNYEEQAINWTRDLFSQLDSIIELKVDLKTEDFIKFYENLDELHQKCFQSYTLKHELLRANWDKYTRIAMGTAPEVPDFIKEKMEANRPLYTFMSDHGIISRFFPKEIVSVDLSIEKVEAILNLISTTRTQTDYIYYTAINPGNPLYEKPIVDIGEGMFQVFEVKQVIHTIENLLEKLCTTSAADTTKYAEKKGKLLEDRIVAVFSNFLKKDFKIFRGYYVDGCEQDILILWKNFAFIIEAKGYSLGEPFRDPNRAFVRIKRDFDASIGNAYEQTKRIEKKFIEGLPLKITDNNGNLTEEIDTNLYDYDFSIIVNIKSFGQIQNDLSTLLKKENEDDEYPWVVKIDDLEVFLLTLKAQRKEPMDFINYLLMREDLHGKLKCSDELEICGGYLIGKINKESIDKVDILSSIPDYVTTFDRQYNKGMGFKNEKNLSKKKSGKYIFW